MFSGAKARVLASKMQTNGMYSRGGQRLNQK